MMMESSPPQQKSQNLFGGFGSSSQGQSQPSTNGFSFGQSTQQPQPQSSAGGPFSGLFGQQKQEQSSTGTGLFGSQPQTNGFTPSFGQAAQTSAPASTGLFGSTSTSAAPTFSFGSASTTATEPAPSAAAPKFSFGQPATTENKTPESEAATTPKEKPAFSFGSTASFGKPSTDSTSSAESPKPAFSFVQPTGTTSSQAEPASAPAKPLFNFATPTKTSSSQAPSNNLFGSLSKPAESTTTANSLFGRVSPANESTPEPEQKASENAGPQSEEPKQPSNPFSSLFGAKQSASDNESNNATKTNFKFGETTSSPRPAESQSRSTNLFGSAPGEVAQGEKMGTPKFSFGQPKVSGGGFSSPKPVAPAPSANLFNLNKSASPPELSAQDSTPQKPASTSLFGQQPSNLTANAGSTPFKSLGQPIQPTARRTSNEDEPPAKKRLFQSDTAQQSMEKSAIGTGFNQVSPAPTEPAQPKITQQQLIPQEAVNRAVSTEGPPQIPRHLSAEKYKSYDENWRLKALNRQFKSFVVSVEPETHDFASLIQNYLDHREAIGEGLSQFMRKQTAGSKRKAADVDDMQEDDSQSKKSRASDGQSQPAPTQQKPATTTSNIFGAVPSPKPPATFSPAKQPATSATSNLFKSMIPGAGFGSTSTTSTTAPTFSFGSTPAKSTTPPSSPPKAAAPQLPKFEVPKFGAGVGDFSNAFAQSAAAAAKKFEKEAMEKRKAEEFDSDEDDEEQWQRQYEEEQRAKRAKVEAAAKGGLIGFIPSASTSRSNSPFTFGQPAQPPPTSQPFAGSSEQAAISIESDGEGQMGSGSNESTEGQESGNSGDDEKEQEDDLPEDHVDDDQEEEEEAEDIPDLPKEQSLFSRIEKPAPKEQKEDQPILQSASKDYYKPGLMFGAVGQESPAQPAFSPFTPANEPPKSEFVPTKTFNFTPAANTGSNFGSNFKDGPVPGEGLFGSRPSTPQPGSSQEKPAPTFSFSKSTSAEKDNTWQKGSPIRFGDSTQKSAADTAAPSIEVSAATPPPKETPKFSFGNSTSTINNTNSGFFGAATSNGASVGFAFGQNNQQPAPGFLSAKSLLSQSNSRQSSPGIPSEAESNLTDTNDESEDHAPKEAQLSLTSQTPGEENEDILYQAKCGLSRNYKKDDLPEKTKLVAGWNKMGMGHVKVLKDKTSGKTRIVVRADPSAHVLLNCRLISSASYKGTAIGKQGAVVFPIATDDGMQSWMIRVASKQSADELAGKLEENKTT